MINPKCNYCNDELNEFGAILLSPPDKLNSVLKFHICKNCYEKIKPNEQQIFKTKLLSFHKGFFLKKEILKNSMKQIKRLQIGKNGLSKEFIEQVKSIFEKEEVLKISILKSACRDKKEAEIIAKNLVESLGIKYGYTLIGYVLTVRRYRKDVR